MMGFSCDVCTSPNPKNKRLRTSITVTINDKTILIDTTPDLRTQVIANGIKKIDAVLFTHSHADHLNGIDDLRGFTAFREAPLPCYASPTTIGAIQHRFDYIFNRVVTGASKPNIELHPFTDPMWIDSIRIDLVQVFHGSMEVMGFRIGDFAYVTDVKTIPETSIAKLQNLELLILGAPLKDNPHPTHINLIEARALITTLNPKSALITHIGHHIDHFQDQHLLPSNTQFAFDGQRIDLPILKIVLEEKLK